VIGNYSTRSGTAYNRSQLLTTAGNRHNFIAIIDLRLIAENNVHDEFHRMELGELDQRNE
jgi:hypothetical protein